MKTPDIAYDICRYYVCDFAQQIGLKLEQQILGYIRSRNLPALADAGSLFDPSIHDRETFRHLRQISSFFKKNGDLSLPECEETAFRSFETAERKCRIVNRRLDYYYAKRDRLDPDLSLQLDRMETVVRQILGDFGEFVNELPKNVRLTSGASSTSGRRDSQPHKKFLRWCPSTPASQKYLRALYTFFGYRAPGFTSVNWNRVEFVPKNWKTHRTIACEPVGNIPLQLAFDSYVKQRLRRRGVDLSNQLLNQELARVGSLDNTLATIDLSAASDSVSYNTVAWLVPSQWFQYLSDIRCPYYRTKYSIGKYAKFSSMGNGATFALETLIFFAACKAIGSKRASVYGDDIIIERELALPLTKLLGFLGFSVNQDKSYTEGPFRESCGKDWFNGVDVTPFYLREWNNKRSVLNHNVNGLASVSLPEGQLWRFLRKVISENDLRLVPWGTDTIGGIHIDIPTSYSLGILRSFNGYLKSKRLLSKSTSERVSDHRTLFLWMHDSYRNTLEVQEDGAIEFHRTLYSWRFDKFSCSPVEPCPRRPRKRSRVPTQKVRYVHEWVGWFPPATATPSHLYWWTEWLTRESP